MNFSGNCILDVIIADTCVYAMDILVFNSTEYSESEAESRLFTLHSRVFDHCSHFIQLSEESYYLILDKIQLPIIVLILLSFVSLQIVPYFECSVENLSSLHANTLHVPLNGLLFLEFLILFVPRLLPAASERWKKAARRSNSSGKTPKPRHT